MSKAEELEKKLITGEDGGEEVATHLVQHYSTPPGDPNEQKLTSATAEPGQGFKPFSPGAMNHSAVEGHPPSSLPMNPEIGIDIGESPLEDFPQEILPGENLKRSGA
jgi:hypothetical protein